ncbi:MAG TPA: sugar phosphate isomerase/epimerase [Candidatus Baltobacteraceae bacterium]|nr:sugar phosphate isomerase/epimerase [Candidatus Baltobacteraceae bacterium]
MIATSSYRLGVSEFTTNPWPFERDVERYAAHGLDAIEVCEFKLKQGQGFGKQLKSIEAAGLMVSSVQTTVHSLFPDSLAPTPADPRERLRAMFESVDRISRHVPQGTPFVVITGAAPEGNCEYVYEFAREALPRLADFAAESGMRVAFEPLNPILFHTDTALWGLDAALELVENIDHPALGICCDTWNIFETPDVASVIRACGKRIFLVQLSDWRRPRNNADRIVLGDGCIPTVKLLSALRAAGYDRPYVIEIFSAQTLPDSLWNGDMDAMLERNVVAFERFWQESEALV